MTGPITSYLLMGFKWQCSFSAWLDNRRHILYVYEIILHNEREKIYLVVVVLFVVSPPLNLYNKTVSHKVRVKWREGWLRKLGQKRTERHISPNMCKGSTKALSMDQKLDTGSGSANPLILDFPTSTTTRNAFVLFRSYFIYENLQ